MPTCHSFGELASGERMFPDVRFSVEDLITENNRVATRMIAKATRSRAGRSGSEPTWMACIQDLTRQPAQVVSWVSQWRDRSKLVPNVPTIKVRCGAAIYARSSASGPVLHQAFADNWHGVIE